MDALSDVLRVTRITGGVFLKAELFEPWCMMGQLAPEYCAPYIGPTSHLIMYHYIIDGQMDVRVEGEDEIISVGAGDVILFPRNDLHYFGSDLKLDPVAASEVIVPGEDGDLSSIHFGGDGAHTHLICGFLGCDSVEGNPLIAALPSALKLDFHENSASNWIRSTLQFASTQSAGDPGSETVLAKMSELLFVEAIRRYAEQLPEDDMGWLSGLGDPYVAKALSLLHGDITQAWTVEELGREVGLSRSALNDRFTRLVGLAPMHYLANWRMQVAAQNLRHTSANIAVVAGTVGYESEAAFSRAFKKVFKVAPGTWRRNTE